MDGLGSRDVFNLAKKNDKSRRLGLQFDWDGECTVSGFRGANEMQLLAATLNCIFQLS
jgi:hypothetical protein